MSSTQSVKPTISKRSAEGPATLSFPQERMFLLDRITPGLSAYNVPALVRVAGTLDDEVLRQACEAVVARHEILRTTIRLVDGAPVQEASPPQPFELTVVDLRTQPEPRETVALELLAEFAGRPFDLAGDVLFRAALVHLGHHDLLLTVLHHVGSDHVSRKLLFDELDALYAALQDGIPPELSDLPIQYADYAQWQREHVSGPRLERLLEYWTGQLAGAPECLEMPADRPHPSVPTYGARLREFTLAPSQVSPVTELARRERATLFMVLLAGFDALLHRYTGSDDLVVGTPVSGRRYPEISRLIGFFSNTLTLRTDASGDPTFRELIDRVKTTTVEAQVHQELPFEKLVEVLNPERTGSRSPIFQVMFGFDVVNADPLQLAGCQVETLPVPGWRSARFDFSLMMRQLPDGSLHGRIGYATDLFDVETIDRFIGHYETLLAAVAGDPDQRLSDLTLLSANERRTVLFDWNSTESGYPCACMHELFAEQARATPDAVAVQFGEQQLTYAELDARANQLAHHLLAMGVGRDVLVGVCVERSPMMLVGLLGIAKAGGAYVPIDPEYPTERQEYMLASSQAPLVLTQDSLRAQLPAGGARIVCLDSDWPAIATMPSEPPAVVHDPEQLAYVIYTSGSTGEPKGVEIPHRALVNFLVSMRQTPGLSADDALVAVTTLSFDIAGLELYLPLIAGARVIVAAAETAADPRALASLLERSEATIMQATPTTWRMLLDSGWRGRPGMKALCGGEALPQVLADRLVELDLDLWNMYGPTETTIWSTCAQVRRDGETLTIGRPIANTTLYILDAKMQPVPIGVAGELWIGGDGLARGYRGRPDLTDERFVGHPFDPRPGARIYRTGDLARYRSDGTVVFLGRIDDQVKVRGFRIELAEIETVLARHPGVASAVVVARGADANAELHAYVIAGGAPVPTDELRRHIAQTLPAYMVPSTITTLEKFPLTDNGKVDRKALPEPDGSRPELSRAYVAPESPVEEALASIWREVLGVDRVGVDDDFFDLGGHSLLAVGMLARVYDMLGLELYLGQVFETSTIRELAAAITDQMLGDVSDEELAGIFEESLEQ
jgi:amino acid adenylation domain-containing protein